MSVLLDVHVVVYSIVISHEDLDEVTSISSCADLIFQYVFSSTTSSGMDLYLKFISTVAKFLQ